MKTFHIDLTTPQLHYHMNALCICTYMHVISVMHIQ